MNPIQSGVEKLTLAQAAQVCGVSRVTMWRWVKSGSLVSATTAGGHHRIESNDLYDFIEKKNMGRHARNAIQRPCILVVDDDPHIQKLLINMLSAKGYNMIAGSNGFEAGILVMRYQPQLVILDLFMPQLDGFQVCRLLKKDPATASIKILAISGNTQKANIRRVENCGADLFLGKPLQKSQIIEAVEQLLLLSSARYIA